MNREKKWLSGIAFTALVAAIPAIVAWNGRPLLAISLIFMSLACIVILLDIKPIKIVLVEEEDDRR